MFSGPSQPQRNIFQENLKAIQNVLAESDKHTEKSEYALALLKLNSALTQISADKELSSQFRETIKLKIEINKELLSMGYSMSHNYNSEPLIGVPTTPKR